MWHRRLAVCCPRIRLTPWIRLRGVRVTPGVTKALSEASLLNQVVAWIACALTSHSSATQIALRPLGTLCSRQLVHCHSAAAHCTRRWMRTENRNDLSDRSLDCKWWWWIACVLTDEYPSKLLFVSSISVRVVQSLNMSLGGSIKPSSLSLPVHTGSASSGSS